MSKILKAPSGTVRSSIENDHDIFVKLKYSDGLLEIPTDQALDYLRALQGQRVRYSFRDNGNAVVIYPPDETDNSPNDWVSEEEAKNQPLHGDPAQEEFQQKIDDALGLLTNVINACNYSLENGNGDVSAVVTLRHVEDARSKINEALGRKGTEDVEVTVAWEQYERREGGSSDGTLMAAPQTGVTTVTVPVEYESESWEDDAVDEAIRQKEGIQYIDERIIVNES